MQELNPEHPVTARARDQWHKIVAILLHKFNLGKVIITAEDVQKLESDYKGDLPVVALRDQDGAITLSLITEAEARAAIADGRRRDR